MVREASAPNFCPPSEEGITIQVQDERGDVLTLEFLGLIIMDDRRYGFFFPVDDENPALSSGEIVVLEATEFDEDDQPEAFELVLDEAIARQAYEAFREAASGMYDFD